MPSRLLSSLLVLLWLFPAAAEEPPPEILVGLGIQAYNAGNLTRAEELLSRALQRQPRLVGAGHYLGLAKLRLGQLKQGRRVLARAARRDPDNPRLLLDLGLAYLKEGNAAWAARSLRSARELDPHNGRVRYSLALALLRLGHPNAALGELMAARHDPDLDWETVRLQLGLAHYQAGRWKQARAMAGPLLWQRNKGPAGKLVRASHEAEGKDASWISGQVGVAPLLDTNPFYRHERDGPPGIGPGLTGSLIFRPYVGARTFVSGDISGSRTFYYPAQELKKGEEDPRDASPTVLHAGATYTRLFPLAAGTLELSGGYSFDLTFLDGDADTDENHIFLEEHTGSVALRHRSADTSFTTVSLRLSRSSFADLPRTNWGNQLQLEHSLLFGSGRGRLLGWLSLRHEKAQSKDYDALTPGVGAGLSWLAPGELVLGLRMGYEHENHYNSASGRWRYEKPRNNVRIQRLDNTLTAMVEVGRALWWGLRLRAVYQRLQNISTVTDFDYGRDLVSLNLTWSR